MRLQQTAGNHAVHQALQLQGDISPPQKSETLSTPPFRIFNNAQSHKLADNIGAHGFTWQGDIYLGSMVDRPHMPSRQDVINHEMVHVKQTWNMGSYASETALEQEARSSGADTPQLAADPNQVLGFWWVVPVAVGAYILLRPKTVNAPGPRDRTYKSASNLQIVGESLSLFAVPGGVLKTLGRAGYGVLSAYAISGAASSVSFRSVQDAGTGEFSGIDAYILDATTGAVIGIVLGGAVRMFAGSKVVSPPSSSSTPSLVHLTDDAGHAGINSSGVLRGSQGIYAVPDKVATESMARRVFRTLVPPSRTHQHVGIPNQSLDLFRRPDAIGPVSLYQRLMGVYRAPAGQINLASGAFAPTGQFANITGQFWPYGVDSLIWLGAGVSSGISLSRSDVSTGTREKGLYDPLYNLIAQQPPLPGHERSDGPFILLENQTNTQSNLAPGSRVNSRQHRLSASTLSNRSQELELDPSVFQGVNPVQLQTGGKHGRVPPVIFVVPEQVR